MAKRVALTSLLPIASDSPAPSLMGQNRDIEASPPATEQTPKGRSSRTASQSTSLKASAHQHYSQLIRKEARLRDDQIESLAVHARRLSRAKHDSNERITDNTLIRIAVDLLLSNPSLLKGNTEAELRNSVGL